MKKFLNIVFVLAMLAMLVYPAWYIYKNPSVLAIPTPSAVGAVASSDLAGTMLATPSETPMLATPSATATPVLATYGSVIITADTVTLRYADGRASGLYLHKGDHVDVHWNAGNNYGVIFSPVDLAGLQIWRGCTSDAGNLGCEAK